MKQRLIRYLLIALLIAISFTLGALFMYFVMWYNVWQHFIDMVENITV